MSGNGQLRRRLGRAEVLAEERFANMISVADFNDFLERLQRELDRACPGRRSAIIEALERAAESVEERGRP
jgi:hypothetical protein